MAAPTASGARLLRFGQFEFDVQTGELRKNGTKLKLDGQPLRLLTLLLDRRGEVVTREEFRQDLWPADTFVDFEHSINAAVKRVRQVLGDSADVPRFIETLPRRGYRFLAPIEAVAPTQPSRAEPADPPVERRWIVAVVAVVLLATGMMLWRYGPTLLARSHRPMVAILPLDNLTGDAEQEYLSDGLTEEIITALGRLDPAHLGVIARTSTLHYKGTRETIAEIGRELGADYVMEGSLRQAVPRPRITLQLIRVSDQSHLWAEAYEGDPGMLSMPKDVAERTMRALQMELPVSPHPPAMHLVPPEAREAFLRGRYALNRGTASAVVQGRDYLQHAIELDPAYAQGYAGLALAYILLGNYGTVPQAEAKPTAKLFAQKALSLDDSLVDARLALAAILLDYELDLAGAEREFRRAVEHDPNSAIAHQWYSIFLSELGRHDEAITQVRTAYELDPVSLRVGTDVARAYYWARRYDAAITQYRKIIELEPNYSPAHGELGLALLQKQRYDEAIAEIQRGMALIPGNNGYSVWLGYAYAVAGRRAEAEKMLARQLGFRGQSHRGAYGIAATYVGLGDNDHALAWLETVYQERDGAIVLNAYPFWDPLRADPRFRDLLRRIGLPR